MRTELSKIRELLSAKRIFLLGPGVDSVADTGTHLPDNQMVQIQDGIQLEPYTTFFNQAGRNLVSMGAFSYTNSVLPMNVKVGRYSSIGSNLKVMGARHPMEWASTSPVFYNQRTMLRTFTQDKQVEVPQRSYAPETAPVHIGHDVWIGDDVTLAQGITIGNGSVIGAGSVVTDDVEPYCVVAGSPARDRGFRHDAIAADDLNRSEWWRFSPDQIGHLDMTDPHAFAEEVYELAGSRQIVPFTPEKLTAEDFAI